MNPRHFSSLVAVALALVSLIAFALRSLVQVGIEYLRAKLGESGFERIRAYAVITVNTLEQAPALLNLTEPRKRRWQPWPCSSSPKSTTFRSNAS